MGLKDTFSEKDLEADISKAEGGIMDMLREVAQ